MPTHNRADYILETIGSICKQTYSNWELLIIDDGSDDNTEELIGKLTDRRIRYYKATRTGIGGKTKNIGLRKMKGQLIAFMDSDDLWDATKLEKQVEAMVQHPDTGFCLTGGYNFTIPSEPVEYFYKKKSGAKVDYIFPDFFRSELPGFTQALMLRKSCLQTTGYFKEERSFSDLDFILSLALHFKAVILYEPLLFRRLHAENYIHSNWEKSYLEGIAVIKNYKNKKIISSDTAAGSLFRVYVNFGEDCLRNKERKKAFLYFFNAWKQKKSSFIPLRKMVKALLYTLTK
jgi:glycosyltransferase involved in cell wall biosynthesis